MAETLSHQAVVTQPYPHDGDKIGQIALLPPPVERVTSPPVERFTEKELLDLLRQRHARRDGNGPRWAFATHVRDAAGFWASRTIDAVAMDTWQSSGFALHGFEVKCSRGDWRRELSDPSKAAAFTRLVHYFWVVAPAGVVAPGELPAGWGLLEPWRSTLRASVKATRGTPEPLTPSFVAALLRAACHH